MTAASILAEIGIDTARFLTAEHICSWAGLRPGNNERAGSWQYLHETDSM